MEAERRRLFVAAQRDKKSSSLGAVPRIPSSPSPMTAHILGDRRELGAHPA
jgi:hypothetical protein